MLDEANSWGFHCFEKSTYIEDLSDAVIDVITDRLPGRTRCCPCNSSTAWMGPIATSVTTIRLSAVNAPRATPSSSSGSAPPLSCSRRSARGSEPFWDALLPHSAGIGSYVNAMTEQEGERVRAAYGPAKFQRLARIKTSYDPDNIFHRNTNIEPG